MADNDTVQMDDDERDAVLANASTGVISFSTDAGEPPHSIPVSFGYDAVESAFYRLVPDQLTGRRETTTSL